MQTYVKKMFSLFFLYDSKDFEKELKIQSISYAFLKTIFSDLKCFRFDKTMILTKLSSSIQDTVACLQIQLS